MTDPIQPKVGSADDYLVKVMTAMNAEVIHQTIGDISIDERKLAEEAADLPQTMFYHSAVYQRISHQTELAEIELREERARIRITLMEEHRSNSVKITVDEADARIDLVPTIMAKTRRVADLRCMKDTIDGVLSALRQKGYSLQLIGQVRSKEEDWLRRSFQERLRDHPQRDAILAAFTKVVGP